MADLGQQLSGAIPALAQALGIIVSFLLGGLNERMRDERQSKREREARKADVAERREAARHEFQLKNLLKLQEAQRRYARSIFQVIDADRQIVNDVGHMTLLPEGVNTAAFDNAIRYSRLTNRVLDDTLRAALDDFGRFASEASLPPAGHATLTKQELLDEFERRYFELGRRSNSLGDALGIVLRTELAHRPEA